MKAIAGACSALIFGRQATAVPRGLRRMFCHAPPFSSFNLSGEGGMKLSYKSMRRGFPVRGNLDRRDLGLDRSTAIFDKVQKPSCQFLDAVILVLRYGIARQ